MAELILKTPTERRLTINKDTSYNDGYSRGFANGYKEGEKDGYIDGREDGCIEGIEIGKAESTDGFWDIFQNYGKRLYYMYAFSYWGETDISPKYMISPTNTAFQYAFQGAGVKNIDWTKFDLSECGTFNQSFNNCSKLESIDAELAPTSEASNVWAYTFSGCRELKSIKKITAQETHAWTKTFNSCGELTDIAFDGVIGNDIDLSACTKLSRDSVVSICEALSSSLYGKTITFADEVQDTCREYIMGINSGKSFAFGDTYTDSGLTFTNNGNTISWTGTLDEGATAVCPLMTEPYTVQYKMCVYLDDIDYIKSALRMTVKHKNSGDTGVYTGSSTPLYLEPGDVIISAELTVSDMVLTSSYPILNGNIIDYMTSVKDNWTFSFI